MDRAVRARLVSPVTLVVASLALVAVLFAVGWATREDPANKPYLRILGGGFMFNYRIAEVYYGFTAVVQKPLATGSTIEASFADPAGGAPLVVRTRVGTGTNQYSLRSPPVRGVQAGQPYPVEIKILDRQGKNVLWQKKVDFTSQISDAIVPDAPLTVGPGYARNR